jgi:hypothetical protein
VEVVENNYKNIYYIMKHREILNILILVASAFLLVAVLSYFNLYEGMETGFYEGMETGFYEGMEPGLYEGLDEQEGEPKKEGLEPEEEPKKEGLDNMPPATGPAAATGPETVLKFSIF